MKKFLKRNLPKPVLKKLQNVHIKIYKKRQFKELRQFDDLRFKQYAYGYNTNNYSFDNLRSKITFHYHSIEKGLSNANLRLGFGNRAFTELFKVMDIYLEKGYPIEDIRFQQAISVIRAYLDLHESKNFNVEYVQESYNKYKHHLQKNYSSVGGYHEINVGEIPNFSELNFKELSKSRHSVRDYGIENVKLEDLSEAIEIASTSPSVCNRQSTFVHLVNSSKMIKEALDIQGGLQGNGANLKNLLIVTSSKEYMNDAQERNQTYIDGGIFLMNLVYGLTYKGIASCILNADFSLEKEKKIRKILNIKNSEDIIAFVAFGSYPENVKTAKSPREEIKNILKINS